MLCVTSTSRSACGTISTAPQPLKARLPSTQRRRSMIMQETAAVSSNGATTSTQSAAEKYGYDSDHLQLKDWSEDPRVREVRLADIRRPLQAVRTNDEDKVLALMDSIQDVGLQEPIDILEVEGQYWGFSGCHRFEAHKRLGKETILCRIRKGNKQVLRFHMM